LSFRTKDEKSRWVNADGDDKVEVTSTTKKIAQAVAQVSGIFPAISQLGASRFGNSLALGVGL
jgi:hypothetical protein